MSDDKPSDDTAGESTAKSEEKSRARADRARLARIFGDVLPETTRDERGTGEAYSGDSDEWLRSQVPPHHGKT
ncbi:hypothetical protein Q8814_05625 [Rhodococcus sp. CC-R104]|uniref:Uncharacterized protein n=1 Tax=Rhodococcus chondri TaxID=3065941 RepID=A0ABU7JNI8_9NOCA|nr:hypothetical protein [Rhodococcus sp. CC-R104]MEE2031598.1 hypothetical protein [Rhodococcus sp. CC-R104]